MTTAYRYAQDTDVSEARSRDEIERILRRVGADAFAYAWEGERVTVRFRLQGRLIQLGVPMPDARDPAVCRTPSGRARTSRTEIEKALTAERRRRWRVLLLLLKASFEAVEAGFLTLDEAFLGLTLLPSGQTAGQWAGTQFDRALAAGELPPLLLAAGAGT